MSGNAFLRRLMCKPGKITPLFDRNIFDYKVILNSEDNKTQLMVVPEKTDDIIEILENNEFIKPTIYLDEGFARLIEIRVTSEFKHESRSYNIEIIRLSSNLCHLETLTFHPGKLTPKFDKAQFTYRSLVAANITYVKLSLAAPDDRCLILVNGHEPKPVYELNVGRTIINIRVRSVDESRTKKYLVKFTRKQIPRYVLIIDPIHRLDMEDPISLSPMHCPMKIPEYDIWSYMSYSNINALNNQGRLSVSGKSVMEPINFNVTVDVEAEQHLDESICCLPLTYGGYSLGSRMCNIAAYLAKCNEPSPFSSQKLSKKSVYFGQCNLFPTFQINLENSYFNISDKAFEDYYEENLIDYFFYLPDRPLDKNFVFKMDENPANILKLLMTLVARQIRLDKSNSNLHLRLGMLLEEKYYIHDTLNIYQDLFHMTSEQANTKYLKDLERIQDIVQKWGYEETPSQFTISQELKALTLEHRSLQDKGMDDQADEILQLYEWRVKAINQEGKIATYIDDEAHLLGQAYNKYVTALSLDNCSYINHFQVGRMLLMSGKYGEAILRLEHVLSLQYDHLPTRIMLAFAKNNLRKITPQQIDRNIELLLDVTEAFLHNLSLRATMSEIDERNINNILFADDLKFIRLSNPILCRTVLNLGRLINKKTVYSNYMKPLHIFHLALHLATIGWSQVSCGDIMCQFEYVIIECHYELLSLLYEEGEEIPTEYYLKRCEWLNSFILTSILPYSERIMDIQENICRYMTFTQPCNEYYLINLGMVLMKRASSYPPKTSLYAQNMRHAIQTFRLAVSMSDKPMIGPPAPYLNELAWFKDLKMNFLSKKAPYLIYESLRLVDNDLPGEQFRPFGFDPPEKIKKINQKKINSKRPRKKQSQTRLQINRPSDNTRSSTKSSYRKTSHFRSSLVNLKGETQQDAQHRFLMFPVTKPSGQLYNPQLIRMTQFRSSVEPVYKPNQIPHNDAFNRNSGTAKLLRRSTHSQHQRSSLTLNSPPVTTLSTPSGPPASALYRGTQYKLSSSNSPEDHVVQYRLSPSFAEYTKQPLVHVGIQSGGSLIDSDEVLLKVDNADTNVTLMDQMKFLRRSAIPSQLVPDTNIDGNKMMPETTMARDKHRTRSSVVPSHITKQDLLEVTKTKRALGDKTSLFALFHETDDQIKMMNDTTTIINNVAVSNVQQQTTFPLSRASVEHASTSQGAGLINPPTQYSRLLLARAYKANHQYTEAIKAFNYIRKLINIPSLKTEVNSEMVQILMMCDSMEDAMEYLSKIHINEAKLTVEDIGLCKQIICLFLKHQLYDDERLYRYVFMVAKHDTRASVRQLLKSYNVEYLFETLLPIFSSSKT